MSNIIIFYSFGPGSFTLAIHWWSRRNLPHFWKQQNCFRYSVCIQGGIWNVPKRVAHGTHSVPSIFSSNVDISASSFDFRLSACLRLHPFAKRRLDTSTRHLIVQIMSNLNLRAFPIHLETLLTKMCPRIQFSKKTNKKFLPCWGKMSLLIIFQRKNRFARMKLTLLLWKSK